METTIQIGVDSVVFDTPEQQVTVEYKGTVVVNFGDAKVTVVTKKRPVRQPEAA